MKDRDLFLKQSPNLCEGNSVVECQLPKLNVAGSIPVPRLNPPRAYLLLLAASLFYLGGCATAPSLSHAPLPLTIKKGVYHKVSVGETLWRIAKTYGVTIAELIRTNNIPNGAHIEKGQLLFIPGADQVKTIVLDRDFKNNEFVWPIKGKVILYFGDRKGVMVNRGIHIRANEGDQVCASRTGKVIFADYLEGYGHTVILDHADGYYSIYAQNAKLTVKLDDDIIQGQPIAHLGGNGELAFLHFEIRKNAQADNPLYYLP